MRAVLSLIVGAIIVGFFSGAWHTCNDKLDEWAKGDARKKPPVQPETAPSARQSESPDAPSPAQQQDCSTDAPSPPHGQDDSRDAPSPPSANSLGMSFATIPAGQFQMGSDDGDSDEKPVHTVRITRAFELQTTEVTQAQWMGVMGSDHSEFKGDDRPVDNVSWDAAQSFVAKLNETGDGYGYRLPTEAEWEYACKAGTAGDPGDNVEAVAWTNQGQGCLSGETHAVAKKRPNSWGLYDMQGNVWELCSDWKADYPSQPVSDPTGPSNGSCHVARGGAWYSDRGGHFRCSFRSSVDSGFKCPGAVDGIREFRVARTPL